MNMPEFELPSYLEDQQMYTLDAIRQGIVTAFFTHVKHEELKNNLCGGRPILLKRKNTHRESDSVIVFCQPFAPDIIGSGWSHIPFTLINFINTNFKEGSREPSTELDRMVEEKTLNALGWSRDSVVDFFKQNKDKEINFVRFSLYPLGYNYRPAMSDPDTNLESNQVLVYSSQIHSGFRDNKYYSICLKNSDGTWISSKDLVYQIDKFIDFAITHPNIEFLISDVGWESFNINSVACLFKRLLPFDIKYSSVVPLFKQVPLVAIKNVRMSHRFVREIMIQALEN